jgi:hypothetical protein
MASPTISTTVSATVPAHHFRRPRPPPHAAFKRSAPPESSPFLLLLLLPSPYSPCHSPLPPLHPTLTPLSAQATLPSINTVLKRRFHLEVAAMKSPRSNPTLCAVSTEGTSLMATAHPHFHHQEVPTDALNLYDPQADASDPVSGLPPPFLSGRPEPLWIACSSPPPTISTPPQAPCR